MVPGKPGFGPFGSIWEHFEVDKYPSRILPYFVISISSLSFVCDAMACVPFAFPSFPVETPLGASDVIQPTGV